MDDRQVLLVSPVEMCPIGLEFHAGHGTVCIIGHYDREKNEFARELTIRNGRLIQNPIREIEQYRRNRVSYQDVLICGETNLHGVAGRMIDMTLNIRPASGNTYGCFRMSLAKDGEYVTTLRYKPETSILKIDRTRSFMVRPRNGALKLRILMDRFSIEVFANDGEQAATVAIFTRQEASAISFDAVGSVLLDVEKYDIHFT